MDYNKNIPNIYDSNEILPKILELELNPGEQYKILFNFPCNIITNNTKLYYTNIKNEYKIHLYNNIFIDFSQNGIIINDSDDIARIKIYMIHKQRIVMIKLYSPIIFLMNNYSCRCDKQIYSFEFTELIIIKTKQKIEKKIKYIESNDIILCYNITYKHSDLYELQLSKIINKINDNVIILSKKNRDSLEEYYNNLYNSLKSICNPYVNPIIIQNNYMKYFGSYYVYYHSVVLNDHICESEY